MKLSTKLAPFLMAPVFAVGCAQSDGDEIDANEGAASAAASVDFTASVGSVVVDGKKVCTAALVDVDAEANLSIGGASVSLSGRQLVMGGACVGKFKNGFTGGAAFVTAKNNASISTPLLSVDAQSFASAGLAIGILADKPSPDAQPMVFGWTGTISGSAAAVATVLRADENGFLVGAAFRAQADVDLNWQGKCTSLAFRAQADAKVAANFEVNDDGLGAAAIVKVNGKLHFAAAIDGKCIVREVKNVGKKIAGAAIDAANDIGDGLSRVGQGKLIAVYDTRDEKTTLAVKLYEDAKVLRINGQGRISASAKGASCNDVVLGACELAPAGGFKAGEIVKLSVDTHGNVFPDRPTGTRLFLSTADEVTPGPSGGFGN